MDVVGISLGGTPGCGVSIDGGTSGVEDSHVVEGEGAGRSGCRAVIGDAACTADNVKSILLSIYFVIVCVHVKYYPEAVPVTPPEPDPDPVI